MNLATEDYEVTIKTRVIVKTTAIVCITVFACRVAADVAAPYVSKMADKLAAINDNVESLRHNNNVEVVVVPNKLLVDDPQ